MPRELTPQELVAFQIDTDYLNAGIPVYGSRIFMWGDTPVLIYRSENLGYFLSDISDMPRSTIEQLAKQSDTHGMWYFLLDSTQEVIAERAEQVANAAVAAGKTAEEITKSLAETIGTTLNNLLAPLVDTLMVPLIITGVLLGIYLIKKG